MDDIAAEVRATFAAIMDAAPPDTLRSMERISSHRGGRSPNPKLVVSILNM
jgi:hypothetical protein